MKKILTIAVIAACMAANVSGQNVSGQIVCVSATQDCGHKGDHSVMCTADGYPVSMVGVSTISGSTTSYCYAVIDTNGDHESVFNSDVPNNSNSLCIKDGKVTVYEVEKSHKDANYSCWTQRYDNIYVSRVVVGKKSKYTSVNVTFADDFPGTETSLYLEPENATTTAATTTLTVKNADRISGTGGSNLTEASIIGDKKKTKVTDITTFTGLETLTAVNTTNGTTGAFPNITGSINAKIVNVHWDENPPTAKQIMDASPTKTENIERTIYLKQNGRDGATVSNALGDVYNKIEQEWNPKNIDGNTVERGNPGNTPPATAGAYREDNAGTQSSVSLKSMPEGYTLEAYATVDEAGNYKFEYLPGGTYIVMIEKDGYTSQPSAEIEVTGESGSISGLAFVVDHDNRTIRPYVAVGGVSIGKPALSLVVGASETLDATITPTDATEPAVTWSSSNPAAATVDEAIGLVTAVAPGEAVITATAGDYTATCTVTVSATAIPVTGVELNQTELSLLEGATVTLMATVLPTDATEPAVTWSSSNPAAATVDEATGLVTAVSPGEAIITATAGDHTATCTVTVESESITAAPELYAPDMKAYPNPFTGTVRLTGAKGCTLRVINTAGTTVHTQNIENPDETVQLEHLPAGVYFLRIEKDGKTKTVKVVKN